MSGNFFRNFWAVKYFGSSKTGLLAEISCRASHFWASYHILGVHYIGVQNTQTVVGVSITYVNVQQVQHVLRLSSFFTRKLYNIVNQNVQKSAIFWEVAL